MRLFSMFILFWVVLPVSLVFSNKYYTKSIFKYYTYIARVYLKVKCNLY